MKINQFILFAFLFSLFSVSGYVIDDEGSTSTATCNDTEGINPFVKDSNIYSNGIRTYDFCDSYFEGILKEQVCSNDPYHPYQMRFVCKYGCIDGACIWPEGEPLPEDVSSTDCAESDSGLDYDNVGLTVSNGILEQDLCLDSFTLKEKYCIDSHTIGTMNYTCPGLCRARRCVDATLNVMCPSLPCEFEGLAISVGQLGDNPIDDPPLWLSARYPYQFNLENRANVTMYLKYRLTIFCDFKEHENYLLVDVERIDFDTSNPCSNTFNANGEKAINLGVFEAGEHFIETQQLENPYTPGSYYGIAKIVLTKVDLEAANVTTNDTQDNETQEEVEEEEPPAPLLEPGVVYEKPVMGGCPPEKVLICHISEHEEEICLGAPAVDSHLEHGDYLGYCVGEVRDEKVIDKVKKNQKLEIEFDDDIKVKFTAKEDKEDSKIIARVREAVPQGIPKHERKVKKYVVIEHPQIMNSEIADSMLEFTVEDSWLIQNKADVHSVILSKYIDDWVDMKTTYIKTVKGIHYYEAESDGFSTFAVTLIDNVASEPFVEKSTEHLVEEDIVAQPEEDTIEQDIKYIRIFPLLPLVIVGLVVLGVISMMANRPKPEAAKFPLGVYDNVLCYIKELKEKKMKDDEIKHELAEAGWGKDDVEMLMKMSEKL